MKPSDVVVADTVSEMIWCLGVRYRSVGLVWRTWRLVEGLHYISGDQHPSLVRLKIPDKWIGLTVSDVV